MGTEEKNRVSGWAKMLLAGAIGAGAVTGGKQLAADSPVHLLTEGESPAETNGWHCGPEGGLIGAPIVCHPPESVDNFTATSTAQ